MTPIQLAGALDIPVERATPWADPLSAAMALWAIDSPARQAMFLAQVGHESGRLVHTKEIWGPTPTQASYECRADLGNNRPGDGKRFMGRGLLQITGRANYTQCGIVLNLPLPVQPEMLEQIPCAALSAAWFWNSRGLNALADANDFDAITRKINGSTNGMQDRLALLTLATRAIA